MKNFIALIISLTTLSAFASNYPSDYCYANVRICKDGAGIVAKVSSGCHSGVYIIGYKKQGILGNNSSVDAIVNLRFGEYYNVNETFRLTPDWHNLGFISSELPMGNMVGRAGSIPLSSITIAFSDSKGAWDSNFGANYNYPIASYQSPNCYSVRTNENYNSQIPFAAWAVINQAMQ
jgi:hypothetical protein